MRWLILLVSCCSSLLIAQENPAKTGPDAVELHPRKWTTLVRIPNANHPTREIPDEAPVRNIETGYSFSGIGADKNHLGEFRVDGRYLLKEGYLRREFGNHALLQLPPADGFELEGIVHLANEGGWLMLLGWNLDTRSGYVLFNTQLKTSGSHWMILRIDEGIAIPDSQQNIIQREVNGEGALKVRVEERKLSLMVANAMICKDYDLPHYQPGIVAIGTFANQYGPQDISIKSLRMRSHEPKE